VNGEEVRIWKKVDMTLQSYYPDIHLERLRETKENISHDNQQPILLK